MSQYLTYLFWPNPPTVGYTSPKALALIVVCTLLIVAALVVKQWRKRLTNAVTKKLSRSWPSALLWFGITGLFFVVCRVEGISFLSIRAWWGVWLAVLLVYAFIQIKLFRARHYEVLPKEHVSEDPREKYLPKQKKRK